MNIVTKLNQIRHRIYSEDVYTEYDVTKSSTHRKQRQIE